MDELKELRTQMAAMKHSLEEYNIVNNRLMRTVMKQRSGWMSNYVTAEIIAMPVLSLFIIAICHTMHMSMWIAYSIIIAMIPSTYIDWKSTMRISSDDINNLSLLELKRKLQKQKHYRKIQLLIELPFCVIWAGWFLIEYLHLRDAFKGHSEENASALGNIIFMLIMLALSVAVILIIYQVAQRTNDRIIEDIDYSDKE